MPRVSVIIDNYNYAAYLPEAIESVLAQTYTDYECIVVDDGSTDDSRDLIRGYAGRVPAIKPVFKENGGQTSAFNAGFAASSGDIVAFLDSDDHWYPDKLERVVTAHGAPPVAQHYLAPNGQGVYRRILPGVDRRDALLRHGYMYNHSPCSGLVFARSAIAPFFPLVDEGDLRGWTDGCLLMLAMTRADVAVLDEVLGCYRIHGANLNANRAEAGAEARKVVLAQRAFANKQLRGRGLPEIPFDDHAYFRHLLAERRAAGALPAGAPVAVYGTEATGRFITEVLREMNVPVWGYADSNPAKWGQAFAGGVVHPPAELPGRRRGFGAVVIASSAVEAIAGTLRGLGFTDAEILALPL